MDFFKSMQKKCIKPLYFDDTGSRREHDPEEGGNGVNTGVIEIIIIIVVIIDQHHDYYKR